jgi:hypothetical protein
MYVPKFLGALHLPEILAIGKKRKTASEIFHLVKEIQCSKNEARQPKNFNITLKLRI